MDIVFSLLLFFVLTYNITADAAIRVRLPEANTAESTADEPVVISVTRAGETFIGEHSVAIEDLPAAVRAAFGVSPGIGLKIKADQEAAVGVLIKVAECGFPAARGSASSPFGRDWRRIEPERIERIGLSTSARRAARQSVQMTRRWLHQREVLHGDALNLRAFYSFDFCSPPTR